MFAVLRSMKIVVVAGLGEMSSKFEVQSSKVQRLGKNGEIELN